MNDKQFADNIHMEIHAVRRIAGYKPTIMEKNVSRIVIERFKDECEECKRTGETIKNTPEKKGLFAKIGEAIKE